MSIRIRIAGYGVIIFVSSAILMVIELAAARLIAPYVGVSLYTWTSIIGVILAGISLGNWLGGVAADRGAGNRFAGVALGLSGIATIAVLFLLTWVAPLITRYDMSMLSASFLYVMLLFFIPAFLLGIITPLLTTLALRLDAHTGHIVGMMHSLAAFGSIIGTFASGYWLIQSFGTQAVIAGTGLSLIGLSLWLLVPQAPRLAGGLVLAGAISLLVTNQRFGFFSPCHEESAYFCIKVLPMDEEVPFGKAKGMVLDQLLHGVNHETHPKLLVFSYTHAMDELIKNHLGQDKAKARYLFTGGGSYAHPRALRAALPESSITVIEIDKQVTKIAEQKMQVDTSDMRVIHGDARVVLQSMQGEKYAAIIGDVFNDVSIPFHLTTLEYKQLVKQRLHDDGIYVLNVIDAWPDPLIVKSLIKTLGEVFDDVDIWMEGIPQDSTRMTYVLSASSVRQTEHELVSKYGIRRRWFQANDLIVKNNTTLDQLPILTDDYVPVESLLSSLITTRLGR